MNRTFGKYPFTEKVYVVVKQSGFGVMESPYMDEGVVFATNNAHEADLFARKSYVETNTASEIASTWTPNTYDVRINLLTKKGMKLRRVMQIEIDSIFENIDTSNYRKVEKCGVTYYLKNFEGFGEPTKINYSKLGFVIPLRMKN